ncbi:hypothetical protein BJ166DRAFT_587626 [Pestalotiopsis sp. NC0098]|nr:hypothetical protein BJ166DRAFT_587626 [Pestalotiopsis sp. NC0098]
MHNYRAEVLKAILKADEENCYVEATTGETLDLAQRQFHSYMAQPEDTQTPGAQTSDANTPEAGTTKPTALGQNDQLQRSTHGMSRVAWDYAGPDGENDFTGRRQNHGRFNDDGFGDHDGPLFNQYLLSPAAPLNPSRRPQRLYQKVQVAMSIVKEKLKDPEQTKLREWLPDI